MILESSRDSVTAQKNVFNPLLAIDVQGRVSFAIPPICVSLEMSLRKNATRLTRLEIGQFFLGNLHVAIKRRSVVVANPTNISLTFWPDTALVSKCLAPIDRA